MVQRVPLLSERPRKELPAVPDIRGAGYLEKMAEYLRLPHSLAMIRLCNPPVNAIR